jgi:predicted alpha/beta superfamily hydrolase
MHKFLIISFLLISTLYCNGQQRHKLTIGVIDSIYSEILNEQREVWISIPNSYDPQSNSKYPALYLLDGDAYFHSLSGIVKQMSSFGTTSYPESVLVAIPNTNRYRDLMPVDPNNESPDSAGIERFTAFLEEELIPFIENKYPTLQHRTLIGHSLGGSFVVNTLIKHQELFTNYLAIDPGLKSHDYRFRDYAVDQIRNNNFEGKTLFLTVANTMPEGMDTLVALQDTTWVTSTMRSNLNFAKAVERIKNNGLDFKWKYLSDENHLSVPTISEYYGLKYFFRWNTLDLDKIIRTNPDISGESFFEKVTGHYQNVTSKLGYETLPGHEQMNDLGYYYLQKKNFEGAVLFFQYNIDNYSNNSNSYDAMGDLLMASEQPERAAEMYKKAIEIDGNTNSTEKLKELNKSH